MSKKILVALFAILSACSPPGSQRAIELREALKAQSIEPGGVKGRIDFYLKDRKGRLKDERHMHNLVTSAGKALVAGRINGSGAPAAATFIAIGTGATAANIADTTCQTEITTNGGARAAGSVSLVTTTVTNDTAQIDLTYAFTGSFAVTESCLLNASSAGTLLSRQVFSAINVVSGDSLLIRWKIQAT